MSNHEEEQALEIEALASIFEEGKEFERCSGTEFRIKLVPYPAGEEENHVGVALHITYTPEYPDVAPEWDLEDVKGLPDEKVERLRATVEETISSSLGMAMVYTVAEACQDFLKENNVKALSMHEEMMQRLAGGPKGRGDGAGGGGEEGEEGEEDEDDDDDDDGAEAEEEEWKGLADKTLCPESERVTIDSFQAWKVRFDLEMIAAGVIKREEAKAKSGKQIFMEAEKASAEQGGAATADAAGGKAGPLVYDAALFGEVEDDDLEDLSGGED